MTALDTAALGVEVSAPESESANIAMATKRGLLRPVRPRKSKSVGTAGRVVMT
jgi:hypothetical protein